MLYVYFNLFDSYMNNLDLSVHILCNVYYEVMRGGRSELYFKCLWGLEILKHIYSFSPPSSEEHKIYDT